LSVSNELFKCSNNANGNQGRLTMSKYEIRCPVANTVHQDTRQVNNF